MSVGISWRIPTNEWFIEKRSEGGWLIIHSHSSRTDSASHKKIVFQICRLFQPPKWHR